MARPVRVSGVQMLVTDDIAANEEKIVSALGRAARDRADFLLTPEASLSGYHAGFDRVEVSVAVERVRSEAKEAGVGLALGTCYKQMEDEEEYCYNQVRIYTPEGEHLGSHAKILRCSPLAHPGTGEMKDYVEGTLGTFDWRGIRFGALICNDLWATPGFTTMPNPYLPWKLKQMGAQFVFHAINSGRDQRHRPFHESSTELWARRLGLPIVHVNAAAPEGQQVNAPSGLVDAEGKRPVVAPDVGEQYFVCEIALEDEAPPG